MTPVAPNALRPRRDQQLTPVWKIELVIPPAAAVAHAAAHLEGRPHERVELRVRRRLTHHGFFVKLRIRPVETDQWGVAGRLLVVARPDREGAVLEIRRLRMPVTFIQLLLILLLVSSSVGFTKIFWDIMGALALTVMAPIFVVLSISMLRSLRSWDDPASNLYNELIVAEVTRAFEPVSRPSPRPDQPYRDPAHEGANASGDSPAADLRFLGKALAEKAPRTVAQPVPEDLPTMAVFAIATTKLELTLPPPAAIAHVATHLRAGPDAAAAIDYREHRHPRCFHVELRREPARGGRSTRVLVYTSPDQAGGTDLCITQPDHRFERHAFASIGALATVGVLALLLGSSALHFLLPAWYGFLVLARRRQRAREPIVERDYSEIVAALTRVCEPILRKDEADTARQDG